MFSRTITRTLRAPAVLRLYSTNVPLEVPVTLPNGIKYMQPTGLFINGEFVKSHEGKTFDVLNPSTEETIATLYLSLIHI